MWCGSLLALWLAFLAMAIMLDGVCVGALRREPSASTIPDPLWYLKKSPSAVADSKQVDRLEENTGGRDSDGRPLP